MPRRFGQNLLDHEGVDVNVSLLVSNLKLGSRSLGAMMDLMRNRANFALTDFVYKSRSIAQGQDSEQKSSNFRLDKPTGTPLGPPFWGLISALAC
jgi:hypothetical protein